MLNQEKGRRSMKTVLREEQESGALNNFMINRVFDKTYDIIIKAAEVTETTPAEPEQK